MDPVPLGDILPDRLVVLPPDPAKELAPARRRWLAFLIAPILLWSSIAGYGMVRLAAWHCGTSVRAVIDARTMRNDVWLFDASGHACRRLTSNGGSFRPLRSPDHAWIAYQSHDGFAGRAVDSEGFVDDDVSLHVMRADGSDDKRVTQSVSIPLRWSTDGTRLTYCDWRSGTSASSPVWVKTVTFPALSPVNESVQSRCPVDTIEGHSEYWPSVRDSRLYWPFD